MSPSRFPFATRLRSFVHAARGIRDFIRTGANARLQLLAAVVAVGGGIALGLSANEWIAVVLCIGLVLAAEAFNTALEELADEVSLERRPRIRRAKDMAAGAVLLTALTATTVALIILARHLGNTAN